MIERRSDLIMRARFGSFLLGSDLLLSARLRDWMARIASVLKMRPLTRGPRLERGPQRMGVKVEVFVGLRVLSFGERKSGVVRFK